MKSKVPKTLIIIASLFSALLITSSPSYAEECPDCEDQGQNVKAKITSVSNDKCGVLAPEEYPESEEECVLVFAEITSGDEKGKVVEVVENLTDNARASSQTYKAGASIWINSSTVAGKSVYYIVEVDRSFGIWLLAGIFIALVLVIGRLQGLTAILGMLLSVVTIFGLVVPLILKGKDPILFGGIAAFIILTASIYLSHGLNKKTTLALGGTTVALIVTLIISLVFSKLLKLTGFGTEEAFYVIGTTDVPISMYKVLIASIMISSIGILDDVTVSQVAVIESLKEENPGLSANELFVKSMKVGKDHIASMVNTLFLVYTGSALPLVLLFKLNGVSFAEIIHHEQFTEEIARTLVGSIGLVLAVPITARIAAESYAKKKS